MYRVGISGWRYPSWRGDFYPVGLPQRSELAYVAERLSSVEINGSFYSLQRPTSYRRWYDETPPGFVFAVKGGRFITHMLRLRSIETAMANFFASGVLALGDKLGPFLWQLPASLPFERDRIEGLLALLPRTSTELAALGARHDDKLRPDRVDLEVRQERECRHAVEVRHPSYADPAFAELLRAHDVACVLADNAGIWPEFDLDTAAGFSYLRLHGDTELYASGYDRRSLRQWADRCGERAAGGRDVHVYFDNDAHGRAPHDAVALRRLLARPVPALR